jgi:hypothetical protein
MSSRVYSLRFVLIVILGFNFFSKMYFSLFIMHFYLYISSHFLCTKHFSLLLDSHAQN